MRLDIILYITFNQISENDKKYFLLLKSLLEKDRPTGNLNEKYHREITAQEIIKINVFE